MPETPVSVLPSTTLPPALDPRQQALTSALTLLRELGQWLPPHPQASVAQAGQVLGHISQILDSLALPAPGQLSRSMARALQHPIQDAASAAKTVQLLQLARGDLQRHLQDLLRGADPLAQPLFEVYRTLERLGGKDSAHPADLWQARGQAHLAQLPPALRQPASTTLPPLPSSPEALRPLLDHTVLAWVKTADPEHANQLCQLCLHLANHAPSPALSSAWQLAAAWLQALHHGLLAPDVYAKRLAARLLMQFSQQSKGQHQPQAQTLHELLFFCDQARQHPGAGPASALLHAICASCQLAPPAAADAEPDSTAAPALPDTADTPDTPDNTQANPAPPQAAAPEAAKAPETPADTAPTSPPAAHPGVLELQPQASLLQGAAALPQMQADQQHLLQAQEGVARLRQQLQAWPEGADAAPLNAAIEQAAQLTRLAWEAGWAEVSTLADRLQRVLLRAQSLPPHALPPELPTHCQQASDELARLLQQLAQGFARRAQADCVQALEHWLATLPAPAEAESPAAPAAPDNLADSPTEPEAATSPLPSEPTALQPLHFAVLEEEVAAQWPLLQAALQEWNAADQLSAPPPRTLLRALHTLKGSARLAGAHDWAAQVHALETLALSPDQPPSHIAQPLEALRLAFVALQQEMDLRHPERQQHRQQAQPLDSLQRHAQALLASHEQAQQHSQHHQAALEEMDNSLHRLRHLIQNCNAWADTLMLHGGGLAVGEAGELPYEWHAELADLLRHLLDATDDLGTVQRQLQHHQQEAEHTQQQHSSHLRALQHSLLYASQQPLAQLEPRLQECLRLAEQDSSKTARLRLEGAQLRLEQATLQALAPALEHLLRNCLAHGIESPMQRRLAGKPAQGQIQLRLSQHGHQQTLVLQDDGAGLDTAAIGQRARALGLWTQATDPDPAQAAELVLQPGLSTAAHLSPLAGRGIGLDAVQAQIEALGGQLQIDSRSGQGCRFTLTLPAPPQVEQIMALRAGNWRVALPAHSVQGQRRIPHPLIAPALAQAMLRGDASGPLPLYWAGALWQQSSHSTEHPLDGHTPVLLLRSPTQRWGLVVDEILPTQEVVLQPPSGLHTPVPGLLGTAVQPSGHVLQVYDPAAVIAAHEARLSSAPDTQPQPSQTAAEAQTAQAAQAEERPHIMLVDDSISVRRLAQHLLTSHGWHVSTAADGLQALEQLRNAPLPALLLVDIEMPDMNGLELLRRLREHPEHPAWRDLPVVMLTAHEAGPVSQQALDMGAQAYLTKPYSPQQLLAQARRYAGLGNTF